VGLRFLGNGKEICPIGRHGLNVSFSTIIIFFILGFLAGGLFVFSYSLKTINQIHRDYREGRYDREEISPGDEKDEE